MIDLVLPANRYRYRIGSLVPVADLQAINNILDEALARGDTFESFKRRARGVRRKIRRKVFGRHGRRKHRPPPTLCAHCGRVARKHFWRDGAGELHGFCRYHADTDLQPVYDERKWPGRILAHVGNRAEPEGCVTP